MAISSSLYLLLSDFDGTMARTFDPSPNRIGVHEAYENALCQVFGRGVLPAFERIGKLRNRDHASLIAALLDFDPSLCDGRSAEELCDELVSYKLKILLKEIGSEWPRACEGFREFCAALSPLIHERTLELGIISSGHQRFIQATFEMWGIECPSIMVTSETVNSYSHLPLKDRVKPAPFPFWLAIQRWRGDASRIIYCGDHGDDGDFAANLGLPFARFRNGSSAEEENFYPHRFPRGSFQFSDWRKVAEFIQTHAGDFRRGLPCAEIFQHYR